MQLCDGALAQHAQGLGFVSQPHTKTTKDFQVQHVKGSECIRDTNVRNRPNAIWMKIAVITTERKRLQKLRCVGRVYWGSEVKVLGKGGSRIEVSSKTNAAILCFNLSLCGLTC